MSGCWLAVRLSSMVVWLPVYLAGYAAPWLCSLVAACLSDCVVMRVTSWAARLASYVAGLPTGNLVGCWPVGCVYGYLMKAYL